MLIIIIKQIITKKYWYDFNNKNNNYNYKMNDDDKNYHYKNNIDYNNKTIIMNNDNME